ncbi:MAG TPA: hypothetical protein VK927_03980 [Adhaeribacter sp.]|nr:hypothetical protein [Adhaeribacter sp.]
MKKLSTLFLMAFLATATVSCNDKDDDITPTEQPAPAGTEVLKGAITSNMTLKADKKYLLQGFVYVVAPAKLTIEPGTIIKGDKQTKGTLIIERGAQLIAEGTKDKPIVFTSNQPKGQRAAGDWGGIIVLGHAPTNLPGTAMIEGGVDRAYGGTNAADNSGIIKYLRLEFSGIAFQPGNEINGLTLGGVGSGTTIDYVQVSYNGDDAFEMFGGTVNAKHLIAQGTVDDMFDTDAGYSGKLQFLLGISDPKIADISKSNGFESDNDANGSTSTPQTSAVFSNVSMFGPKKDASSVFDPNFGRGMHIRRNSSISLHNSVVAGWPVGLLLDGSASEGNATSNMLVMKNNVLAGNATALAVNSGSSFDINAWYTGGNNTIKATNAELKIENSFNINNPGLLPGSGSELLTGADFAGMDAFFERVAFKGAFGTTDWTAGWANFDPQNTDY